MKAPIRKAMERLAQSSWGRQGIGACPNEKTRRRLVAAKWARPVKGERPRILALTLNGFRALEEARCRRALELAARRGR